MWDLRTDGDFYTIVVTPLIISDRPTGQRYKDKTSPYFIIAVFRLRFASVGRDFVTVTASGKPNVRKYNWVGHYSVGVAHSSRSFSECFHFDTSIIQVYHFKPMPLVTIGEASTGFDFPTSKLLNQFNCNNTFHNGIISTSHVMKNTLIHLRFLARVPV
jgi:hypothetical protein